MAQQPQVIQYVHHQPFYGGAVLQPHVYQQFQPQQPVYPHYPVIPQCLPTIVVVPPVNQVKNIQQMKNKAKKWIQQKCVIFIMKIIRV